MTELREITEDNFGEVIEQNDKDIMEAESTDDKNRKAKMVPISVCFKARKL